MRTLGSEASTTDAIQLTETDTSGKLLPELAEIEPAVLVIYRTCETTFIPRRLKLGLGIENDNFQGGNRAKRWDLRCLGDSRIGPGEFLGKPRNARHTHLYLIRTTFGRWVILLFVRFRSGKGLSRRLRKIGPERD